MLICRTSRTNVPCWKIAFLTRSAVGLGTVFLFKADGSPEVVSTATSSLRELSKTFTNSLAPRHVGTLQELIAPREVKFFGHAWNFIATKSGLIQTISAATGIQASILAHTARVSSVSVAQRMSWAAHRETSRLEDQAYSLLGIFK